MKWAFESRWDRLHRWHRYFCWWPQAIGNNKYWLQYVWRKGKFVFVSIDPMSSYWDFEFSARKPLELVKEAPTKKASDGE